MGTIQTNITLGTAGHIDHGKTALIKCLTGCDTDRLKAEKERGMSIDLGFAPCTVSGLEVGIVDVPGHENFIKTMVAGASGIDGAIFVIAADDGVMPQTREHLDILTLLGVEHGIVALTKVDCIEPDRLATVTAEVKDFLAGTFLENAPILPVSSITGQGFDAFYEALYFDCRSSGRSLSRATAR
ncbi:MAG: GTP-binding protein [Planctomycetota bacterium]|jgi:selenocysteine-specific elongation factor